MRGSRFAARPRAAPAGTRKKPGRELDWSAVFGAGAAPSSPLGNLVWRPALYSRNAVAWATCRAWRSDAKAADLAALKAAKALPLSPVLAPAAAEVAEQAARLVGRPDFVTTVPCGHSRRSDCFAKQLAVAVADRLGAQFVQFFADRFVSGSSHPKEFSKLQPLERLSTRHDGLVLVVDDVATSGWHMEECLTALRANGHPAFGFAWIGGDIKIAAAADQWAWLVGCS